MSQSNSELNLQMQNKTVREQLEFAVTLLNQEDVVAMPTETVYGLAGRIDSQKAVEKIFSVKQRPFFDPLIVHVSSLDQAKSCVKEWTEMAQILAENFWPGPLTLVLPKSERISDTITSGLTSVGVRWPRHEIAQQLIAQVGVPLAAPSANKFGRTSPTQAGHVRDEFLNEVFVIDSGNSEVGIESTVLSVKKSENFQGHFELSILRKGLVGKSQIDAALEKNHLSYVWVENTDKKESPGQMKHHYMPPIPFVICRRQNMKMADLLTYVNQHLKDLPDVVEGVRLIKPADEIESVEFLNLSAKPEQAARQLYSQLRSSAERGADIICFIQNPKQTGEMWEAVFDRLNKAASLIIDESPE